MPTFCAISFSRIVGTKAVTAPARIPMTATDGRRPILDVVPQSLHQRTPLFIGSKADVAFASEILSTESVPA